MKQIFLLFLCIFTTDSFASGIPSSANNAPCTNNTLETYSGNSNLAADWQPNEIQLRWYNNNTLMDVQSSANTCTYDDTLTVPTTAPTRTGYTFAGWTVRPEMDFSTIPTNLNGTERWSKGLSVISEYCFYDTTNGSQQRACSSDSTFQELQKYEWKVNFEHGDLYGMAGCSTDISTLGTSGRPTIGSGSGCWCKATGYKASNTDVISAPSKALSWVFERDYGSSNCGYACSTACAYSAQTNSYFRVALFSGQ